MNKKISRFVCLLLVTMICLSIQSFTPYSVIAQETEGSKITMELQETLNNLDNDDIVPVYVWIDDIDYERVKEIVFDNTGLSEEILMDISYEIYKPLKDNSLHKMEEQFERDQDAEDVDVIYSGSEVNEIQDIDEAYLETIKDFYEINQEVILQLSLDVDTYITEKRAVAREEYDNQNNAFVAEYLNDANILFISSYAPMIIAELTKNEIYELEDVNKVESIYLYDDSVGDNFGNMDISIPSIKGDLVRDNIGYNGYGIKIGQIEKSCPQTVYSELSSTNITIGGDNNYSDYYNLGYKYHASLVAAIIAGSSGMVPQSHLYCTSANYFYANAEWLISSGVTVINCSYGHYNGGAYDNISKWVDHVVNQHLINWVQASGNAGENGYVCSEGLAYNAITVGAINDNGTVSEIDDTYYSDTSYNNFTSCIGMKPDVVAPGCGFRLSNVNPDSGTSYSTPHVTGMVAQMIQFMPTLSIRPDAVKAAVLASCDRKVTSETMAWITDKEGAGVINAVKAINFINNIATQQSCYDTTASSFGLIYDPITYGTKTVAISWLKQNTGCTFGSTTDPTLTNFNLKVLDEDNNVVASSQSYYNSAELVRFTAIPGITYTIKVTRYTNNSTSEKLSIAFGE